MWGIPKTGIAPPNVSEEDLSLLHRALLLTERERTRSRGQRMLQRLTLRPDPYVSAAAHCGMASSYFWSNDFRETLSWLQQTVARFPMSREAIWALTLLVAVFRTLGMKRERFDAERERLNMMRRVAFHGERDDRIFALSELVKEFESRDLEEDASRMRDELADLVASAPKLKNPSADRKSWR